MTDPARAIGSRPVPLAARTIGFLILAAVGWITLILSLWVVAALVLDGGIARVNLVVLGIPLWGVMIGLLTVALTLLFQVVLSRFVPHRTSLVVSAVLGWAIGLTVWLLVLDANTVGDLPILAISAGTAAVGAGISIAVSWPRSERN